MKKSSFFPDFFSLIMLLFVCFLAVYLPSSARLSFLLRDAEESLNTSQGRERKQQYEYEQVQEEIPSLQSQLDELLPQVEVAQKEVAAFKAERKQLRARIKELESADSSSTEEKEESTNE